MTRIEFDSEDFNTFLRCLMNLKEICNDVDIRGGMIRQRTNDLTSVFEMDLTSLITDAAIPITNLKKKLDLLKTFAGQDVALETHEGETEEGRPRKYSARRIGRRSERSLLRGL